MPVPLRYHLDSMEDTQPLQVPAGPKTSVLIVSHNSAAALRRCLDALQNTTAREAVEILVVDKGSHDGSAQLDADYPNVTFVRLPRNYGFTKAVNIGTRTAAGDYLLLLDPRVEAAPGAVAALAARLDSDDGPAAVCPLLVDEEGAPLSRFRAVPNPGDLLRDWKRGRSEGSLPADLSAESIAVDFPPVAAVLVRKQFVKGMNYLDERYGEAGADAELFYQIWHASRKVLLLPGVRMTWRPANPVLPPDAEAQLSADQALGAVVYARKRGGLFTGLGARIGAVLHILLKLLTFQQSGFQSGRLMAVVSGQKIDGSQTSI